MPTIRRPQFSTPTQNAVGAGRIGVETITNAGSPLDGFGAAVDRFVAADQKHLDEAQKKEDSAAAKAERVRDSNTRQQAKLDIEGLLEGEVSRIEQGDVTAPNVLRDFDALVKRQIDFSVGQSEFDYNNSEALRLDLQEVAKVYRGSIVKSQRTAVRQRQVDLLNRRFSSNVNRLRRSPDELNDSLAAIPNVLAQFEGLSEDQKRDAGTNAVVLSVAAAVEGLSDQGRFDDARSLLESGRFDSEISADAIGKMVDSVDKRERAVIKEAEAAAREEQKRAEAELKKQSAVATSNLEIAVKRGQAGYEDIELAFAGGDGFLGASDRTRLIGLVDSRHEKEVKRFEDIERVTDALRGEGPPLHAGSKADREAVDKYFEAVDAQFEADREIGEEVNPQGHAQRSSVIAALVEKTRIVPSVVKSEVVTDLRSGSVELAAAAVDLVLRMEEVPGVEKFIPEPDRAMAVMSGRMIEAGTPPKRAIEMAREATAPRNEAITKARTSEVRKSKARDLFEGWLVDHFDEDIFGEPELVAGRRERILSDFATLYEGHFVNSGDEETARRLALRDIGNVWGVSRLSGDQQLVRYPVENYYPLTIDEIRTQLAGDIEALNAKPQGPGALASIREQQQALLAASRRARGDTQSEESNSKTVDDLPGVFLIADQRTAREVNGGSPSYLVVIDNEGVLEVLPDRWRPDISKANIPDKRAEALRQRKEAEETNAERAGDSLKLREATRTLGAFN